MQEELQKSDFSKDIIEALLLEDTVEPLQLNEIAQKCTHKPEILDYILHHQRTPEITRQFVARLLQMPVPQITEDKEETEPDKEESNEQHRARSLFQTIQRLKVGEKIQLALRGSREIRTLLLRDSSKEVVMTVLENPKISDSEIEILAKQKATPDEILRTIAKNREWLKNYSIMHALVTNPKTPTGIALQLVTRLRYKDLQMLEKNRNISEAVRSVIKKTMVTKSKT